MPLLKVKVTDDSRGLYPDIYFTGNKTVFGRGDAPASQQMVEIYRSLSRAFSAAGL